MPDTDNIFEFPGGLTLQWAPYERMLREAFADKAPPAALDEMMNRIKPIFFKHAKAASEHPDAQHDSGTPRLSRLNAWVAELTFGLLTEIVAREGRLIELGDR